MANFFEQKLIKGLSYADYQKLIEDMYAVGKATGEEQTEGRLNATKLNISRMHRLDKTIVITPALEERVKTLKRRYAWLILTEGWCADSAQNLPAVNKIAQLSQNIQLYFFLRDDNLDLMDKYLTNGGRSIPKIIAIDVDTYEVLGEWGPRPQPAQAMKMRYKENPVVSYEEFQKEMQLWYTQDKTLTLQNEFMELFKEWESK